MASFRIRRPPSARRGVLPDTPAGDGFGARLLKLIPAEAVALYLAGRAIILADEETVLGLSSRDALLAWTTIGLVAVLVSRWWGTSDRDRGEGPQLGAIGIAAASYLIWVYSLGDVFAELGVHDAKLGGLLVIVWTFSVPYFYRGSEAPPPASEAPPGV